MRLGFRHGTWSMLVAAFPLVVLIAGA